MFEVYTGTGENKDVVATRERRNKAILLAWRTLDKEGCDAGVRYEGKIVFHTNFDDPEFLAE